jgi:hypothetical protein
MSDFDSNKEVSTGSLKRRGPIFSLLAILLLAAVLLYDFYLSDTSKHSHPNQLEHGADFSKLSRPLFIGVGSLVGVFISGVGFLGNEHPRFLLWTALLVNLVACLGVWLWVRNS